MYENWRKVSDYAITVSSIYLVTRNVTYAFKIWHPIWNLLNVVTFTASLRCLCCKKKSLSKPETNRNWRYGPRKDSLVKKITLPLPHALYFLPVLLNGEQLNFSLKTTWHRWSSSHLSFPLLLPYFWSNSHLNVPLMVISEANQILEFCIVVLEDAFKHWSIHPAHRQSCHHLFWVSKRACPSCSLI